MPFLCFQTLLDRTRTEAVDYLEDIICNRGSRAVTTRDRPRAGWCDHHAAHDAAATRRLVRFIQGGQSGNGCTSETKLWLPLSHGCWASYSAKIVGHWGLAPGWRPRPLFGRRPLQKPQNGSQRCRKKSTRSRALLQSNLFHIPIYQEVVKLWPWRRVLQFLLLMLSGIEGGSKNTLCLKLRSGQVASTQH